MDIQPVDLKGQCFHTCWYCQTGNPLVNLIFRVIQDSRAALIIPKDVFNLKSSSRRLDCRGINFNPISNPVVCGDS